LLLGSGLRVAIEDNGSSGAMAPEPEVGGRGGRSAIHLLSLGGGRRGRGGSAISLRSLGGGWRGKRAPPSVSPRTDNYKAHEKK